jgi:O-acetylhomoserine/O-acetylserine sulfhydrylase-like pyridoxal-dependent enzyme
MALFQCLTDSFKLQSWQAVHDLSTDTLKFALYTSNASLGSDTAVYTVTGEVSGAGYSAGGVILTGVTLTMASNTAYLSFTNPSWSGASFVCRGALIYNSTKGDKSIAVLDFGADKTASGAFTVTLPVAGPTTALIRFE